MIHHRSGMPLRGCTAGNSINGNHERDSSGYCALCGSCPKIPIGTKIPILIKTAIMNNHVSPISAEEFLPCPFCGSNPTWIHHSNRFDGQRLMSLGCCGFRKVGLEDNLIAAWNTRPTAASGAEVPSDLNLKGE